MTMRRLVWIVAALPWALAACGAEAPRDAAGPVADAPATGLGGEASELHIPEATPETRRAETLLVVEGSDTEGVLFRGWPWCVQALTLRGEPPSTVQIDGPSRLEVSRVDAAWLVAESETATATEGQYSFEAGGERLAARVVTAPASLSPKQIAVHRRLSLWSALARGDSKAARAVADAWLAAEPASHAARAALGDVLRASGDRSGALAAYGEAIARLPAGLRPPSLLHRHIGELLREQATEALAASVAPAGAVDPAPTVPDAPNERAAPSPRTTPSTSTRAAPPPGELVPASEWTDAQGRAATDGQWALRATASSQYSAPQYAATQATGAPDVKVAGDAPEAWCPGANDDGQATLELEFATIAAATGVRVRQNAGPGAIAKVEAIAVDGREHVWWQGRDPLPATAARDFAWFVVRVPATPYEVSRLRLTLDLASVAGWNQIDAVQLVGTR
ncbi:MAG: hypothetical protein MUC36_17760 [Planctomycetes bacterium]|jgi:hypothetical protein|nr:hypothetical protein [Planctomycetota bacterium]